MIVGIFTRADHPLGWGFVQPGDATGRAHGYVLLFVRCDDDETLTAVQRRLSLKPFHGVGDGSYFDGNLGEWFGGRFELVATAPDISLDKIAPNVQFACRGDNRMVAVFDAAAVLGEKNF